MPDVEETELRGDVRVRVTGDGGRELVVIVEEGGLRAAGTATVLWTDVPRRLATRETQHAALARGRAYYAVSEQALAAAQTDVAWNAAQQGIAALALYARNIKDDSIVELGLAEERRASDPLGAARAVVSVLRGRLRKYAVAWHDEVL